MPRSSSPDHLAVRVWQVFVRLLYASERVTQGRLGQDCRGRDGGRVWRPGPGRRTQSPQRLPHRYHQRSNGARRSFLRLSPLRPLQFCVHANCGRPDDVERGVQLRSGRCDLSKREADQG